MRSFRIVVCGAAAAVFLGTAGASSAATLLDTGAPALGQSGGAVVAANEDVGAFVSFSGAVTITDISAFLAIFRDAPGDTFTIQVWSTVNALPGTVLDTTTVASPPFLSEGWVGATGLDWELGSGGYWFTYSVYPGSNAGAGWDPISTSPLLHFSARDLTLPNPEWNGQNGLNLTLDLDGSGGGDITFGRALDGAPEPNSWALMIVGFGISGMRLRRRRTNPDLIP